MSRVAHAGIDIVHRHRGDEAGKALGMLAAKLREAVVGDARERGRPVRRPEHLDRRIGEREHLLQAVELVHHAQPRVYVPQRGQLGKRGQRDVARHELREALEDRLGHEVIEDVEVHGLSFSAQSSVIRISRIAFVQRAISARMKAANSSGVLAPSSMPWLRTRSLSSGRLTMRTVSAFSLATMSLGVPAGASSPYQVSMSM